ncbi:LexA family protein [Flavobacterium sp.]|jgi:DNA polymerase V|uniref:LexA family protein n=1 Tax=Flavobacterium sp. TaxID=239 RepID=UPI0037BFE045
MSVTQKIKCYFPDENATQKHPFFSGGIKAGFPSPAGDFEENKISLDKTLVKNTEATFYAKAVGNSMTGVGIDDGDILVIDRSLEPVHDKIAICLIDGEFTVKRIKKEGEALFLMPENSNYKPIEIKLDTEFTVWGIVTYVIKKV